MWTTVCVHACERCSHAHRDRVSSLEPLSTFSRYFTSRVSSRQTEAKLQIANGEQTDILTVLLVRKRLIHFTLYLDYQTHNTGKVRDFNDISPVLEVL